MGLYEKSLLLEEEIMDEPEMVLVRRVDLGTALGVWKKFYPCDCQDCQDVKGRIQTAIDAAPMSWQGVILWRAICKLIEKGKADHV